MEEKSYVVYCRIVLEIVLLSWSFVAFDVLHKWTITLGLIKCGWVRSRETYKLLNGSFIIYISS